MKILRKFLSCCGGGAATTSRQDEEAQPAREAETRSLVPVARRCKRRLRLRSGPLGSVPPEWKPSLCVISEDTVVVMERAEAAAKRPEKRKTAVSKTRVHVRTHSDDFGRSSFSQLLPAFSPAPFLF